MRERKTIIKYVKIFFVVANNIQYTYYIAFWGRATFVRDNPIHRDYIGKVDESTAHIYIGLLIYRPGHTVVTSSLSINPQGAFF